MDETQPTKNPTDMPLTEAVLALIADARHEAANRRHAQVLAHQGLTADRAYEYARDSGGQG